MLFWNVSKTLATGKAVLVNQHILDAPVETIVWSPFASDQFLTVGDNFAKLWKFHPTELLRSFSIKFTGSKPHIISAAFIYHEMKPAILLGSKDGTIYRVNISTLQVEDVVSLKDNGEVNCIQSLSNDRILIASSDGLVQIYQKVIAKDSLVFSYQLEHGMWH
jgi:WD40 repeat protein